MFLNGRELEPFDPFHSSHPATILGPEEVFRLGDQEIRMQPVTLPHHKKVSTQEWERYAGPEGYVRNQGFYVYRGKRLIIHGTWFKLMRQTELTKLARVRIDMPNSMDSDWKIDLKKASAQPPEPVRARLRKIIEKIGATSKRVYTTRGKRLVSDSKLPVWKRDQNKNQVFYSLNYEHPVFTSFSNKLAEDQRREFWKLLGLASSTLPIDSLILDMSSDSEKVSAQNMDDEAFIDFVRTTYLTLKAHNEKPDDIELMMYSAEPFRSNWTVALRIIKSVEQGESEDG